jgi:hypothetical protein
MPVARSKDDSHDLSLTSFRSLQRSLHLNAEAVVRVQELRADEQQHQVSRSERFRDGGIKWLAWSDAMVRPQLYMTLALEHGHVDFKLRPEPLVYVAVGNENARHGKFVQDRQRWRLREF